MSMPRRSFTRDDPETRRAALIAAALDLMAEDGPQAATVRAIADAAGLSQGMIRHYFSTKEELINAAYQAHMEAQLTATRASLPADGTAMARLARIITVSLTPPVSDPRTLSLWAAFIHMIRRDPAMRATHERNYLRFRDLLESLIVAAYAESGRPVSKEEARCLAIACNAVLDGLWLEGGALPEAFAPGELEQIGMTSVSAILGLTLECEAT
jgi:AcrR family transcriptional regulator